MATEDHVVNLSLLLSLIFVIGWVYVFVGQRTPHCRHTFRECDDIIVLLLSAIAQVRGEVTLCGLLSSP